MKKSGLFILLSLLFIQLSLGQIERTEYKVIDEIESTYKRLFFNPASIIVVYRLVSIRNLLTEEKIAGIEIEVNSTETEVTSTSSSISFSNFSNLWDVSISSTYETLNKNGFILLSQAEALE